MSKRQMRRDYEAEVAKEAELYARQDAEDDERYEWLAQIEDEQDEEE